MLRNLAFVVGYAVFQLLATTAWAAVRHCGGSQSYA
jgi:hypothetical protein